MLPAGDFGTWQLSRFRLGRARSTLRKAAALTRELATASDPDRLANLGFERELVHEVLAQLPQTLASLSTTDRNRLCNNIEALVGELRVALNLAKPLAQPPQIFNPLDREAIGDSLLQAFDRQPRIPFPPPNQFAGIGVYALYYEGDNPLYKLVTARNKQDDRSWPIYVGKGVAQGSRKGGRLSTPQQTEPSIYKRLMLHKISLDEAGAADPSVAPTSFYCRYLVIDDTWIRLCETFLIEKKQPVWNLTLDGFGNNPQGKGRKDQQRSKWDTLHPGRTRVQNQAQNVSYPPDRIRAAIGRFLVQGELPPGYEVEPEEEQEEPGDDGDSQDQVPEGDSPQLQ